MQRVPQRLGRECELGGVPGPVAAEAEDCCRVLSAEQIADEGLTVHRLDMRA